jgi:hypothetical protein
MKIDFKRLPLTDIEGQQMADEQGQQITVDISKSLGNFIYNETRDLGELELAQQIYKYGELELSTKDIEVLGGYIKTAFKAVVQKAFNDITGYGR